MKVLNGEEKSMSFRVAFLVGQDNESTRQSIEAVCALEGVAPVGILLDTHRPSLKLRIRNLYRNLAREGWTYGFRRLAIAILDKLRAHAVNTFVDPEETNQLLR